MLGSENGSGNVVDKPEVAEVPASGKLTGYMQRRAKLSRTHVLRAFYAKYLIINSLVGTAYSGKSI